MSSVVGMVVEDCLLLLLNLLKNNVSNQNYLKEGSYIQRLPLCLDIEYSDRPDGDLWSAQKVTNVHLMLEVWLFVHLFIHSLISFTHSLIHSCCYFMTTDHKIIIISIEIIILILILFNFNCKYLFSVEFYFCFGHFISLTAFCV